MVVSNIFDFHPYLGKISNLTHIFQMGGSTTNQIRLDYFPVEFRSLFRGKTLTVTLPEGSLGCLRDDFRQPPKTGHHFCSFFFAKIISYGSMRFGGKNSPRKKAPWDSLNERMIWPQNDVVCKVYFLSNMANVAVICFQFQGVGQNQISNGIKKNMTFITP